MISKLLILLTLLLQISCASDLEIRIAKKYEGIDQEFKPYVDEFYHISNGRVKMDKNLSIGFRDFPQFSSTIGVCHYVANEIDINKYWWNNSTSQNQKLSLILHEMGHCVLKRGHTSTPYGQSVMATLEKIGFFLGIFKEKTPLADGCPASLMESGIIEERCLETYGNYYYEELFSNIESRKGASERDCKEPRIINETETWNERDTKTLERSKNKCLSKYNSCLKVFNKKTETHYNVLCE